MRGYFTQGETQPRENAFQPAAGTFEHDSGLLRDLRGDGCFGTRALDTRCERLVDHLRRIVCRKPGTRQHHMNNPAYDIASQISRDASQDRVYLVGLTVWEAPERQSWLRTSANSLRRTGSQWTLFTMTISTCRRRAGAGFPRISSPSVATSTGCVSAIKFWRR